VIRQRKKRISRPYDLAPLCTCALMSKPLRPTPFFLYPMSVFENGQCRKGSTTKRAAQKCFFQNNVLPCGHGFQSYSQPFLLTYPRGQFKLMTFRHRFKYSLICQDTSTTRQRSDHFGFWVKLPSVTTSLTTQR